MQLIKINESHIQKTVAIFAIGLENPEWIPYVTGGRNYHASHALLYFIDKGKVSKENAVRDVETVARILAGYPTPLERDDMVTTAGVSLNLVPIVDYVLESVAMG